MTGDELMTIIASGKKDERGTIDFSTFSTCILISQMLLLTPYSKEMYHLLSAQLATNVALQNRNNLILFSSHNAYRYVQHYQEKEKMEHRY